MGLGNSYSSAGMPATAGDSNEITVSGAVLAVCALVVQQILVVKRKVADLYVEFGCLDVMVNIASEATGVDRVVAECVVGLVEFLVP